MEDTSGGGAMPLGLDVDLEGFRSDRPPVLLLGGLNILRALGRAGIPTIVASRDPEAPAFRSRFCRGQCLLPPLPDRNALIAALLAAGERLVAALGRRVPLVYGNDDDLGLICEHRHALARHFLFLLPEEAVGRALLQKPAFGLLAARHALPVPRTFHWHGGGPDAVCRAEGPVLVKPSAGADWERSEIHLRLFEGKGKALVLANGRAAKNHRLIAELQDQLTFQEYIPGGDDHLCSFHGFADERGELLGSFVGRKVRTFPALTGDSTFLELAYDAECGRLGREVVGRLPLRGPFKIDMKRDSRTGRLLVLEINARFNLWHYLGACNGINLPAIAYDYLLGGRRPGPATYRTTYRWIDARRDFRAYRDLSSRGELTFAGWLGSLFATRKVYNLFAWADPLPYLGLWRARVKSRLDPWRSTAS